MKHSSSKRNCAHVRSFTSVRAIFHELTTELPVGSVLRVFDHDSKRLFRAVGGGLPHQY